MKVEFKNVTMSCRLSGVREVKQVVERLEKIGYRYDDSWDVETNLSGKHYCTLVVNDYGDIVFTSLRGYLCDVETFDTEAFFKLIQPADVEVFPTPTSSPLSRFPVNLELEAIKAIHKVSSRIEKRIIARYWVDSLFTKGYVVITEDIYNKQRKDASEAKHLVLDRIFGEDVVHLKKRYCMSS